MNKSKKPTHNRTVGKSLKTQALFAGIFSLFALLSWQNSLERRSLLGDAPEYLITAQSIIKDHDIFLENNARIFEPHQPPSWAGEDLYLNTKAFPKNTLINPNHVVNVIPRNGHFLPYHPIGLSILISPGQALFGAQGASLTIALCAALLALNIYLYTKSLGKTLLIVFSPPLLYLSLLCFKEIPVTLLTFYAFRKIKQQGLKGALSTTLVSSAIAFLPWLHPKYTPISGLLLLLLYQQEKLKTPTIDHRRAVTDSKLPSTTNYQLSTIFKTLYSIRHTLLAMLASLASLLFFYVYFYGTWKAVFATGNSGLINPATGLLGLFFDREYGLVLNYPLYTLAILGFIRPKALKKEGFFPPTLIGLFFLGIGSFGNWHGGVAPAGRLIAPALPFLGLYLPEKDNSSGTTAKIALTTLCLTLAYLNIFKLKNTGCIAPDKINETYELIPYGRTVSRLFPSITNQLGKLEKTSDWWK